MAQDKISEFTVIDLTFEDSFFDLNSIELWIEDSFKDFEVVRSEAFQDLDGESVKLYGTSHKIDLATNTFSLCFTITERGHRIDNSFIEFNCKYNFVDVLSNHPEGCYENYVNYYRNLSIEIGDYPNFFILHSIFHNITYDN